MYDHLVTTTNEEFQPHETDELAMAGFDADEHTLRIEYTAIERCDFGMREPRRPAVTDPFN